MHFSAAILSIYHRVEPKKVPKDAYDFVSLSMEDPAIEEVRGDGKPANDDQYRRRHGMMPRDDRLTFMRLEDIILTRLQRAVKSIQTSTAKLGCRCGRLGVRGTDMMLRLRVFMMKVLVSVVRKRESG